MEPETRRIEDIIIGDRFRKHLGSQTLDALRDSMADVGLLHPVVITPENRLIAGRRRITAAKALDWEAIPVRVSMSAGGIRVWCIGALGT